MEMPDGFKGYNILGLLLLSLLSFIGLFQAVIVLARQQQLEEQNMLAEPGLQPDPIAAHLLFLDREHRIDDRIRTVLQGTAKCAVLHQAFDIVFPLRFRQRAFWDCPQCGSAYDDGGKGLEGDAVRF